MAARDGRCCALVAVLALGVPRSGRAADAWIDADLAVQLYELSSPFGAPRLERRRFTHTLGVRGENLTGSADPLGPRLDATVRARLDADVAIAGAETDPDRLDAFIPGHPESPTDLMVAYVEGRRYLDGHLGFRLGRQYVVDALGWWSLDGALLRVDTPVHLAF
jgi:hypothetical protein